MTDKAVEKLWEKFADTPVNDQDEIETDFHIWKKGTNKFDIWHWFDEEYSKGLAKGLMGKKHKKSLMNKNGRRKVDRKT